MLSHQIPIPTRVTEAARAILFDCLPYSGWAQPQRRPNWIANQQTAIWRELNLVRHGHHLQEPTLLPINLLPARYFGHRNWSDDKTLPLEPILPA